MNSTKKLLTTAIATAALSCFSIAAQAWEPTFYAGGNLGTFQHKQNDYNHHFTVLSVEGVGGINLIPYLAVEARIGAGYNEDRQQDGSGYDLRENYYGSFYLKPQVRNEHGSVYLLFGATSAEISSNWARLEDSDTGYSFGAGLSVTISEKIDVTAEWKKQISTDLFDIRGGTVGFIYKF